MLTDYASANGTELWNTARLQAYLTNVGSPFDTGPEICRCETLTAEILGQDAPYTVPGAEDNPAPWFDADYDHSAEFLGFLPLTMQGIDDNPRARNVTNAVGGGGVFSPVRDLPRTITVTGVLIGNTCCGADYGLHFLTEVLNSCAAQDCDGGCIDMYSCCPDPGMTAAQFLAKYGRSFRRASLISGPTVTNRSGSGNCPNGGCTGAELIEVEFVIVAASPWAWTEPTPVLDVELPISGTGDCVEWCLVPNGFVCPGAPCLHQDCAGTNACADPLVTFTPPPQPTIPNSSFCIALAPERACYELDLTDRPRWSEDVPIITVYSGDTALRNVRIAFYERLNTFEDCNTSVDDSLCSPHSVFTISFIPAGSKVTIDGRIGKAFIDCGDGCQPASTVFGDDNGGPLKITPLDCAKYCVCIESDNAVPTGSGTEVTIELSGRGL